MIALRVEDGYGGAVVVTILPHERLAVVDVEGPRAPMLDDVMLDADDLRDLARLATLAASMLDEVTS